MTHDINDLREIVIEKRHIDQSASDLRVNSDDYTRQCFVSIFLATICSPRQECRSCKRRTKSICSLDDPVCSVFVENEYVAGLRVLILQGLIYYSTTDCLVSDKYHLSHIKLVQARVSSAQFPHYKSAL
jgi:hypothetical protein